MSENHVSSAESVHCAPGVNTDARSTTTRKDTRASQCPSAVHQDSTIQPEEERITCRIDDVKPDFTRLLVETAEPWVATLLRETVTSATSRLKQAFVFGRPHDAEGSDTVEVTASDAARHHTLDAVEASPTDAHLDRLLSEARSPSSFRAITTVDAVRTICGYGTVAENLGVTNDYMIARGVDGAILDRHCVRVE